MPTGRKLNDGGWRHRDAAPEKRGWTVYARSTTIQAHSSAIDDGIAFVRDEVMPALQAMQGYVGLSLLIDRESGRCIATSAWESEEALRISTDNAAPLRDQAGMRFGGGDVTVDLWEIGAMHREHRSGDAACVRATWIKMPRDQVDRAVDFYRASVLPALEQLEGFCSASFMLNRATGRGVSSATFDSREAMDRNQENARELRNARTRELGADIVDVGEFDLALAHLRLPEMA
jgi:heme-degrading monooxygenase HmoA